MSGFHDVRFPDHISYGSSGGPQFSTAILELPSGYEQRNINWSRARAIYEVSHNIKNEEDMDEILSFFYARWGRAYSFRFKDWADYQLGPQIIGIGDGATFDYQIIKRYQSDIFTYDRELTKIVQGSLVGVTVGGISQTEDTDFTLDYNTGVITFIAQPGVGEEVIVLGCEFDVHVRFDVDLVDAVHEFWQTQSWPSIPLKEVREIDA